MIRRLGLLACVVALAAGCGTSSTASLSSSRTTLEPRATEAASAADKSPVSAVPDASTAAAATPAAGSHGAALDSETKPYIVEGKYPHVNPGESARIWGEYPIEIELTPVCATVGTAMRAVVKTGIDARVGGSVRYIDGKPHEDFTYGRAPTGEWVWTWTIKPDVPHGQADVFVTAGAPGEGGGAVITAFTVAASC